VKKMLPMLLSLASACTSLDMRESDHASASAQEVVIVRPNPRDADAALGDLDVAILFARLPGAPANVVDPDDVATAFGHVSGGFVPPGYQDPGFITVAEYFQDASYDDLRLHKTVFAGVLNLPGVIGNYCSAVSGNLGTTCSEATIFSGVLTAAESSFAFEADDYDAFVLYVSGYFEYVGVANVQWNFAGTPRRGVIMAAHIDRPLGEDSGANAVPSYKGLLLHELGHALGDLRHAGIWQCYPDGVGEDVVDPAQSCPVVKADPLTPLGVNYPRDLSAYEKSLWGFFSLSRVYWLTITGQLQVIELGAIEVDTAADYQEIRIPLGPADTFYSVEYRKPLGPDAAPLSAEEAGGFANVAAGDALHGLVVRLRSATLDFDQPGETLHLPHLVKVGEPFWDPYRAIWIGVQPLQGNRAQVTLGKGVVVLDP
jgi:hypothetical protein